MERRFLRENAIFGGLERHGYGVRDLMPAFPDSSQEEITQRLLDNALRYRRTVERFGYLGTRECSSRYFNVTPGRYRRAPGAPPVGSAGTIRVHCYGGSTTAGHNVGDDETWPHYLEANLRRAESRVRVLNYGAGNHTSLHSALHLLDHCLNGKAPHKAIFFNGFNDCYYAASDPDGALAFLDKALELSQHSPGIEIAIGQLARMIPRLGDGSNDEARAAISESRLADLLAVVRTRYRVAASIQDMCRDVWGVTVRRFWEPSPFASCRLDQDLVPKLREGIPQLAQAALLLRAVAERGTRRTLGIRDLIDLTRIGQDAIQAPLFLDEAHATPALNRHLAEKITLHCGDRWRPRRLRRRRGSSSVDNLRSLSNPDSDLYPLW